MSSVKAPPPKTPVSAAVPFAFTTGQPATQAASVACTPATTCVGIPAQSTNGGVITSTSLITASGILLAFLLSFYTLIARERKSPYLINSAVWILLVCMTSALAASIAIIVDDPYRSALLYAGSLLLLVAVVMTVWRVYRLAMRLTYFIDSANPKHFFFFRWIKKSYRSFREKKVYEHDSVDFSEADISEIVAALTPDNFNAEESDKRKSIHLENEKDIRSLAMRMEHQGQANENLAKLVFICLSKGYLIQYLTASRHPVAFIDFLKKHCELSVEKGKWANFAKQIIVIDAYTPHFGFTDSVYQVATADIARHGVTYLASTETYAGLHTAAAKAFNTIKKNQQSEVRKPSLIIYEDCYALADLESVDQYRIFLRHVVPSEKLWAGMLTVFIETVQADNDWNLLKAYVDAVFDLRK